MGMNGGPVTPYLHLGLGAEQNENANWAKLDDVIYKLAFQLVQDLIGPGMISQSMLAKPSVDTPELFDNAVKTPKIADLAVTRSKLDLATQNVLPPTAQLPADAGKILTVDPSTGLSVWLAPGAVSSGWNDSGVLLYPTKGTSYPVSHGYLTLAGT